MSILFRVPTSDYSVYGTWAPATNLYENVDDPVGSPDDATTTIVASTASASALFSFTRGIPAGATINYVKVVARALITGTPYYGFYITIRAGGTTYNSAVFYATTAYSDYTNTWSLNPKTGVAWSAADLNNETGDALFGYGVTNGAGSAILTVTQVYLEVGYSGGANDRLTQEGAQDILRVYFGGATVPTAFNLGLAYKTGDTTDTYADISGELTGSGYARQAVNRDETANGWVTSFVSSHYQSLSKLVTFTASANWTPFNHLFLVTTGTNKFSAYANFSTSLSVLSGQTVDATMTIRVES